MLNFGLKANRITPLQTSDPLQNKELQKHTNNLIPSDDFQNTELSYDKCKKPPSSESSVAKAPPANTGNQGCKNYVVKDGLSSTALYPDNTDDPKIGPKGIGNVGRKANGQDIYFVVCNAQQGYRLPVKSVEGPSTLKDALKGKTGWVNADQVVLFVK